MSTDWQPKKHPVHFLIDLADRIRATYDTFLSTPWRDEKLMAAARVQIRKELDAVLPCLLAGQERRDIVNRCAAHFARSFGAGSLAAGDIRKGIEMLVDTLEALASFQPIRSYEVVGKTVPRDERPERADRFSTQLALLGQAGEFRQRLIDRAADTGEYIPSAGAKQVGKIPDAKDADDKMSKAEAHERALRLESRYEDSFLASSARKWAKAIGCSLGTVANLWKDEYWAGRVGTKVKPSVPAVGFTSAIEATTGTEGDVSDLAAEREEMTNRLKREELAREIANHASDERLENRPQPRRRLA